MKLRSHLVVFAIVTIVPVLVAVAIFASWVASVQQDSMERNVRATARALALAVDRELKSAESLLAALAASPALDAGDFASLHRQAVAVSWPGSWITVIKPDGTQMVNTLRPFGAALPQAAGMDAIRAVVERRSTVVSNVYVGAVARRPIVSVSVPVIRNGMFLYSIDMSFGPERFRDMLREQRLPERWFAEIIDRQGANVARTRDHERTVGTHSPAAWRTEFTGHDEGWATNTAREGDRVYKAWTTSGVSGWRLAVAVPEDVVHGPRRRAMWLVGTAGGLFVLLLGATAFVFGRRITKSARTVVESANALGRGHGVPMGKALAVTEFETVNQALVSAQEMLSDRAAARERLLTEQLAREEAERREEIARSARELAETAERRWRVLSEIARAITASLDLDVVLQRILHGARELCASDSAAIFLRDVEGLALVPRYRTGEWPASYHGFRVEPGRGAGGHVMVTGHPFRTDNYMNDPALPDPNPAIARDTGTTALMVVPILIDSRVDGLLYLSNRSARSFSDADEAISVVLAEQAAVAIRNSQLYAAERTARADAETANRLKDEFLAMLGHELRNPLSAIAGAAGVLKQAPDVAPPIAERARAVIDRQVQHLARLVDDLLDVGRVVTGKVRLDRRRLDLGALATSVMNAWRAAGRFARHDVTVGVTSVWIEADETRIEQVLDNLVGNALKYTPAGGRVTLRIGPDGPVAVLEVADSGPGLPPNLGNRMFELFVQGDRTLDRSQGGLGIGLTLVRSLVELHGGTVEGKSNGRDKGAVFTVRLPRISAPADDPRPLPGSRPPAVPRCIVVVEDNDDTREMLRILLVTEGHEVHEAADGNRGVEVVMSVAADIALVDVGLPGLDGYEVARRIRATERGKSIRLVALTGYGRHEDRIRALDAGFDAHLTKPVAPERLAAVIADVLAKPRPDRAPG